MALDGRAGRSPLAAGRAGELAVPAAELLPGRAARAVGLPDLDGGFLRWPDGFLPDGLATGLHRSRSPHFADSAEFEPATVLVSVPMPSISMLTSWPGSISPTPAGVPVRMTSPGSRVV